MRAALRQRPQGSTCWRGMRPGQGCAKPLLKPSSPWAPHLHPVSLLHSSTTVNSLSASTSHNDPSQTSTSASTSTWHSHAGPGPTGMRNARRQGVSCQARRRRDEDEEEQQSYGYKRSGGRLDVNINGQQISVPEGNVVLAAVLTLGLAAVLGPLIIGVVVAAVAVGAAVSLGAVALSFFWVPFLALFGFLAFGLFLPFGAFATLGLGLFFPKLVSMAIAGAGMALGWSLVSNLIPSKTTGKVSVEIPGIGKGSRSPGARPGLDDGPTIRADSRSMSSADDITAEEAEIRRVARELREFDSMMADREEEKRVDDWRKKTMGR